MQRNTLATSLVSLALVLPLIGVAAAQQGPPPAAADRRPAPMQLDGYPEPAVTGEQIVAGVKQHAEDNPLRITGSLAQQRASDELAAEARELGLEVQTRTFGVGLSAVIATKPGTDRAGEVIVFGGHLDSMLGTVEGAYDNGTGVRTVMELARAYADVPTHRTMEFHFYNGEEQGALGSTEVAADYKARGVDVSAYLGFDMTGIAWPVAGPTTDRNCLCMWRGARDEAFDELLREVNYDFLDFPEDRQLVSIEGANRRNSDEASWADEGYRTLRWAGLRRAADYPQYHLPLDNLATIDTTAGGREFFEQGLRNTLLSSYYTAAALDLEGGPVPAAVDVPAEGRTPDSLRDHPRMR